MNTIPETEEKGGTGGTNFKSWYARNRDALAAKRKAQRAANPSLRSKLYADKLAYESTPQEPKMVNGVLIYSRVAATAALGICATTLRSWLQKGYIPDSRKDGERAHSFTQHQVDLMRGLSSFLASVGGNSLDHSDLVESKKQYIWENWNGSKNQG